MNVERFQQLIDINERTPEEEFSMAVFCGSICCLFGNYAKAVESQRPVIFTMHSIANEFEITVPEASFLFNNGGTPLAIAEHFPDADPWELFTVSKREAIDRCIRFLEVKTAHIGHESKTINREMATVS